MPCTTCRCNPYASGLHLGTQTSATAAVLADAHEVQPNALQTSCFSLERENQVAVRVGYRETEQGKEANGKTVCLRKERGNGSLRHPEIYKRAKK